MVFNRERDVCFGRAFNSGHADEGFWENFADWVVRAPAAAPVSKVSGGPGWYIIDDQSAGIGNDYYIVVSNHTAANVTSNPNRYDEPHKILKVGYNSTEAGYMRIEAFLWWDVAAHAGHGCWSSSAIADYDSAAFVYDFRGGPNMMCISSRLGVAWYQFMFGEWEGDANLVDPVTTVGTLQGGIVAGNHVTIQLAAGEASRFTDGHFAYLYDMNGHTWCNYVELESVNVYTDQIVIDQCNQNFPAGSVIGAYVHRFFIINGQRSGLGTVGSWKANDYYFGHGAVIPYVSGYGGEMVNQALNSINYMGIHGCVLEDAIGDGTTVTVTPGMAPNDRGLYACQRPVLSEYYRPNNSNNSTAMNRAYGPTKNVWVTCINNLMHMVDGRRINNLNHVHFMDALDGFHDSSNRIVVVPDYDSLV